MIGPVQEKDTITSVKAMKKMPPSELVPALASERFDQEPGSAISNAPRNESPKVMNKVKKIRLAIQFVARLFSAAGPKITVTANPVVVKMVTMEMAYQRALRR